MSLNLYLPKVTKPFRWKRRRPITPDEFRCILTWPTVDPWLDPLYKAYRDMLVSAAALEKSEGEHVWSQFAKMYAAVKTPPQDKN